MLDCSLAQVLGNPQQLSYICFALKKILLKVIVIIEVPREESRRSKFTGLWIFCIPLQIYVFQNIFTTSWLTFLHEVRLKRNICRWQTYVLNIYLSKKYKQPVSNLHLLNNFLKISRFCIWLLLSICFSSIIMK